MQARYAISTFQTRLLVTESAEKWTGTTKNGVDASAIPLGTMQSEQVDDILDTIQHWLPPSEEAYNENDVHNVDLLVQRLTAEHATNTFTIQSYTNTLAKTQAQVLRAWLSFGANVTALESADRILFRLVDWYRLDSIQEEMIPLQDFITISNLWLETNTPEATAHVVDLLLWWTDDPKMKPLSPEDVFSPLFQRIFEILSASEDSDTELVRSLVDRVVHLQNEWGWNDKAPRGSTEETGNEDVQREPDPKDAEADSEELPSFELDSMKQQFLELIETATEDDSIKVEDFAKKLNAYRIKHLRMHKHKAPARGDGEVFVALYDYYIRVKNPAKAMQWLRKIELVAGADPGLLSHDRWQELLRLWSESKEKEAPWRAKEIIKRMEELDAQGILQVSGTAYSLACETWLKSGDPAAGQKVLDILRHVPSNQQQDPDPIVAELILRVLNDYDNVDASKVSSVVCSILKQGWTTESEREHLQLVLEKTMNALAKKYLSDEANSMLRLALEQDLIISPSTCEHAIRINQNHPMTAYSTIELLEQQELAGKHVSLSFECYVGATGVLLNSGMRGISKKEKHLVSRLLDRLANGDIAIPPQSDIDRYLTWVLSKTRLQGRAFDAESLLLVMEAKLMTEELFTEIKIPVDCFNQVLLAQAKRGAVDKVEETFSRLLRYYRSGVDHLIPTTSTFHIYLKCLADSKNLRVIEKAEELVEEMLDLHQMTGREECKPDDEILKIILLTLKELPSKKSVDRAFHLFDRLVALGVQPTTFTFTILMAIVVRNHREESYRKVVQLMDQLVGLGLEPNSNTYNVFLNGCANANRRDREYALSKAFETMRQLRTQAGLDKATYPTFVKALGRLLKPGDMRRDKLAGSTMKLCCEDGYLTPNLEIQFSRLLSNKAWKMLYHDRLQKDESLRKKWTRNVQGDQ